MKTPIQKLIEKLEAMKTMAPESHVAGISASIITASAMLKEEKEVIEAAFDAWPTHEAGSGETYYNIEFGEYKQLMK